MPRFRFAFVTAPMTTAPITEHGQNHANSERNYEKVAKNLCKLHPRANDVAACEDQHDVGIVAESINKIQGQRRSNDVESCSFAVKESSCPG